eukprot:comp17184_c2_seq1/m.16060 comp17184_c2_seq1/g.16060  ORF comp17184_c2_seq1/g.16060 comp17184_c2_seq1/m.16060 type:complete len:133 (-) comp17184_c2_seq1:359-757(-)
MRKREKRPKYDQKHDSYSFGAVVLSGLSGKLDCDLRHELDPYSVQPRADLNFDVEVHPRLSEPFPQDLQTVLRHCARVCASEDYHCRKLVSAQTPTINKKERSNLPAIFAHLPPVTNQPAPCAACHIYKEQC